MKQKIFAKEKIDYFFFMVPDKSVVCSEYLPFSFNKKNRHYNHLLDIFSRFYKLFIS